MPYLAKKRVPIPDKDLLSWMFDAPPYDQDKPIYIDAANPSRSISNRQAKSHIRKLIAGLHRAGVKKGDAVCIHSFNNLFYPVLVLAIIGAGAVFTGTNPAYTPAELAHHLKMTQTNSVIVESNLLASIRAAAKTVKIPESRIFTFDEVDDEKPTPGFTSWRTFFEAGEEGWIRFDDYDASWNTTAMLLSTSGTTGFPKAAMLSHYNLVAQHMLVWEYVPTPYDVRVLVPLPMFHAAIVPVCHTSALRAGRQTFIMRRFELEPFLEYLVKYEINELLLVPPIVVRVVMSDLTNKYSLKGVKKAMFGAAPLDGGVQRRFAQLVSGTATQVFGMTEASCIILMTPYPQPDLSGSVGKQLPNIDMKLVDDSGADITGPGKTGELCFRGPTIIRGYLNNPEANKDSFDEDGYYHSGDIGRIEPDTGNVFIVDRKKELIKVRGFQVAPPEIEGVLLTHPGIVDAAVIGITRKENLEAELPRAYVVLRPGAKLTEKEVVEYAGSRLAKYKSLEGGVRFVSEIPKTASGKILKRLLREQVAKESELQAKL